MNLDNIHLDLDDILPGLIWAVILVVWAVGKLFRAARGGKKGAPPGAPPGTPPGTPATKSSGAEELRNFLETLTGQKIETQPETRPERRIELEPVYTPPPLAMAPPAQTMSHAHRRPQPAAAVEVTPQAPMTVLRPTQIRGTDSSLVGLDNLRLPGASLPKAQLWGSTQRHVSAGLVKRDDLRKAMVQRIVLGPPVALGGQPAGPDLPEY